MGKSNKERKRKSVSVCFPDNNGGDVQVGTSLPGADAVSDALAVCLFCPCDETNAIPGMSCGLEQQTSARLPDVLSALCNFPPAVRVSRLRQPQ